MKNKNKRELEKRWATEAAKKRKAAKNKAAKPREDVNQAATRIVREATGNIQTVALPNQSRSR